MKRISMVLSLTVAATLSTTALAQTDAGAPKDKPTEKVAEKPADDAFTQEAQLTGGGNLNLGNVFGGSLKTGGFYGFRAGSIGMRFDAGAGVIGLAVDQAKVGEAAPDPADYYTKVNADGTFLDASPLDNINTNAMAKVRFDFFPYEYGSIYASAFAFHDSAQNLLARLRGDVGYRHFLFNVPKHVLSAEAGLVYTVDNSTFDGEDSNGDGKVNVFGDKTRFEDTFGVLGARIGLNYQNALSDLWSFTQTVEVIPNISFAEGVPVIGLVEAPFEQARVNANTDNKLGLLEATVDNATSTLSLNLVQNLALSLSLNLGYDNGAIARRNAFTNWDVGSAVTATYKLF
jgi:hypothetical protein